MKIMKCEVPRTTDAEDAHVKGMWVGWNCFHTNMVNARIGKTGDFTVPITAQQLNPVPKTDPAI